MSDLRDLAAKWKEKEPHPFDRQSTEAALGEIIFLTRLGCAQELDAALDAVPQACKACEALHKLHDGAAPSQEGETG